MTSKQHIHLYPYQSDMVNRIEKAFVSFQSVMVQMPTGTGKTHVIAAVAKEFVSKGQVVWMVAHRRELVTQIRNTLGLYLSKDVMKLVEVRSVQWLTRHIGEMKSLPSLIVIDEAHHALAKTYSFLIKSFPEAKKLGVTATPYRLSGEGFTDLFDTLLVLKGVYDFMIDGRLSLYDYYSVKEDDEDLQLIKSIRKRGTDGDYDAKELDSKYNQTKTIEHLFASFQRYAAGCKGFIYAMNIKHAENIASYYVSKGVKAVVVSSHTPKEERHQSIEAFRNGYIQVLVSVDLFSEGIDVPDAEFIQLARPTLSLAKHLQMVGRGLRVTEGKEYCVIIDNVGNYWNFGLPSDDRDWQEFFNGYDKNKVRLFNKNRNAAPLYVLNRFVGTPIFEDEDEGKFERVADHQEQKEDIAILNAYHIVTNASGLQGLTDNKGNIILPCEYNSLKKDNDGIVTVKGKKNFYLDLFSGRKYSNRPKLCRINGFPVALYPGYKLYFRIRSRFVSNQTVIDLSNIPPFPLYDILRWDKYLFFHKEDGWKTYGIVKTSKHGGTACEGEDGGLYVQGSPFDKPQKVESMEAADQLLKKYEADYMHWLDKAKSINISHVNDVKNIFDKCRTKYYGHGIYEVTKLNGEKYWLDIQEKIKFLSRPHIAHYGIINLMYIDDVFYVRNYEHLWLQPLRLMDIHSNDKACIAHGKVWNDKSGGANEIVFISPDKSYVETKDRQYHYSYSMLDGELKISRFRATLERDKSSK